MKRRGFSVAQIAAIRAAYKLIYKSDLTMEQAKAALQVESANGDASCVAALELLRSFLDNSTRGIVR
jgi:UDP-N-acetylglucosamine acyltransferase